MGEYFSSLLMGAFPVRPHADFCNQWNAQLRDILHQAGQVFAYVGQFSIWHFKYQFIMDLQNKPGLQG